MNDTGEVAIQINDQEGDSVTSLEKTYYWADTWRYRNFGMATNQSGYMTLKIWDDIPETGGDPFTDSLTIDRIEIYTTNKGAVLIE